jgi:hypothetical protein
VAEPDIFDWSNASLVTYRGRNTREKYLNVKSFQDSVSLEQNIHVFPFNVSYSEGETLCKQLGGELAMPYNESDFSRRFVELSGASRCVYLWLPIKQKIETCKELFYQKSSGVVL